MTDRPTRILLLGTHGQHNIGDELLLETFLHQLGEHHSYVINTYDKSDTAARLGTRYHYELIDTAGDRLALLRHLRAADVIVFAGGSILKELSPATGRHRHATLLMILILVVAARRLGRAPIAMLNIGVGPIATRRGRGLARRILDRVDLVTVRDAASVDLCRRIGTTAEVSASTDAVLSVEPGWLRRGGSDTPCVRESEPLRIALSLNRDIEVPENWAHVVATLGAAIRAIALRRPLQVHGLPMQSRGKAHDDATVLREFAAAIPEVDFIEHLPDTHSDVARILDSCDLLIGERLHALITAAKLGVPVVPLVYDTKVREAAVALGVDALGVDLSGPFTVDQVVAAVSAVADDRSTASARLDDRVAALTRRARTGFDSARAWIAEGRR